MEDCIQMEWEAGRETFVRTALACLTVLYQAEQCPSDAYHPASELSVCLVCLVYMSQLMLMPGDDQLLGGRKSG